MHEELISDAGGWQGTEQSEHNGAAEWGSCFFFSVNNDGMFYALKCHWYSQGRPGVGWTHSFAFCSHTFPMITEIHRLSGLPTDGLYCVQSVTWVPQKILWCCLYKHQWGT